MKKVYIPRKHSNYYIRVRNKLGDTWKTDLTPSHEYIMTRKEALESLEYYIEYWNRLEKDINVSYCNVCHAILIDAKSKKKIKEWKGVENGSQRKN